MTHEPDLAARLAQAIADEHPGLAEQLDDPATAEAAHLTLVRTAAQAVDETSALLQAAVDGARTAGSTWEVLGGALGMTRQAAQQRFGRSAAGDEDRAGDTTQGTPPARRVRVAVSGLDEMRILERAGLYGWHSVANGALFHTLEKSDEQWEHSRVAFWNSRSGGGWEPAGGVWFPVAYRKRRTGRPALPEPTDPTYLTAP